MNLSSRLIRQTDEILQNRYDSKDLRGKRVHMTKAVCWKCGEFKSGSFVPCPACNADAETDDELLKSLFLTSHYHDEDGLTKLQEQVRRGTEWVIPDELKEQMKPALEDVRRISGIGRPDNQREPNKKKSSIFKSIRSVIRFFLIIPIASFLSLLIVGLLESQWERFGVPPWFFKDIAIAVIQSFSFFYIGNAVAPKGLKKKYLIALLSFVLFEIYIQPIVHLYPEMMRGFYQRFEYYRAALLGGIIGITGALYGNYPGDGILAQGRRMVKEKKKKEEERKNNSAVDVNTSFDNQQNENISSISKEESLIQEAESKLRAGNDEEAFDICNQILREINPENAFALLFRGYIYNGQKRYKLGTKDLEKASSLNSSINKIEYFYKNLGSAYQELGKKDKNYYNKAIEAYTKGINLEPSNSVLLSKRGACKCNLEMYSEAEIDYTKAIEIDPKKEYFYHRGMNRIFDEYLEDAILDFKEASSDYQDDPSFLYSFACAYRANDDYEGANENYKKLFNIGMQRYKNEDYQGTIEAFKQALALYPDELMTNKLVANSYLKIGEIDKAYPYVQEAMKIDPKDEQTKGLWKKVNPITPERLERLKEIEKKIEGLDDDQRKDVLTAREYEDLQKFLEIDFE